MGGRLLVIVPSGRDQGRRFVRGDRGLGTDEGYGQPVVARQLRRLRVGIVLQRTGDREVQPRARGVVRASR